MKDFQRITEQLGELMTATGFLWRWSDGIDDRWSTKNPRAESRDKQLVAVREVSEAGVS